MHFLDEKMAGGNIIVSDYPDHPKFTVTDVVKIVDSCGFFHQQQTTNNKLESTKSSSKISKVNIGFSISTGDTG